jgi:cell division protein FtsZ
MQGEMRITVIATGFTGEIGEPPISRQRNTNLTQQRTAPLPSEQPARKQPGTPIGNESFPQPKPPQNPGADLPAFLQNRRPNK